ncbi:MAG: serine--tRNA ligase [Alphaproteobacteria bacterium]|nr:serine--tRNA ligase [Alphaproteobacteria bacterium]
MFDIKWIRDNPREFDAGLTRRGLSPQAVEIVALDAERRKAVTAAQDIQSRRNALSKEIGAAKSKGDDAAGLIEKVASEKELQATAERQAASLSKELDEVLAGIPNLADTDVPDGADDTANVEIRSFGEKPAFDFTPKEHFDIGEGLGGMDFEGAAKLSGSRFVVLKGALARLSRALGAFMLDLQTNEFGYTEIIPPLLVRDDVLFGTGQLPKFAADQFRTTDDYWLIPTAEVPLTNLVRETILEETDLPLRFAALTPCFRSEAGAAGKDTRGMYRQHQFDKVELVSVTTPEDSPAEHERMTGAAEEVLKRLGLHYRVVVLSTGDMGFGARKTYDIEVWLPGQGRYREISSCSNCWDFQARRMNARFRPKEAKGTRFVHTLNGSGLAVGRALIAVLENRQFGDGTVAVPDALQPYMGGLEVIGAAT